MKAINSVESKLFQSDRYTRKSPKFGVNGTTYSTKGERKHRDNHANRKRIAKIVKSNEVNTSHPAMVRVLPKSRVN